MPKKSNTDEFIAKANIVHHYKYDYTLSVYQKSSQKIAICCAFHGIFKQKPNDHLNGYGCPRCGKTGKYNQETFVKTAIYKYQNRYSYLKTVYTTSKEKICITCPKHGDFWQKAADHLYGYGCNRCAVEECHNSQRSNTNEFVKKAQKFSENRFTYEKVNYVNNHTKVIISCIIHGDFEQTPNVHLSGVGCPRCNASKGELSIESWLKINKVCYQRQLRLKKCIDKKCLPYDFGIFNNFGELQGLIEFQGRQHFLALNHWGGISGLEKVQRRDNIKQNYCEQNKIPLLIIPYTCYNEIENILQNFVENL